MKSKISLFKISLSGLLSAYAIAMSFLESLIPQMSVLPPGMKIGFSNVAVMIAAKNISFASSVAVSVIKSVFVLVTRGFTAFMLSLAGGLVSATVTYIIFRQKSGKIGCIGAGIIGAESHNITQVAVYSLFIGKTVFWYLPVLLAFGAVGGVLTGTVLYWVEKKLRFFSTNSE